MKLLFLSVVLAAGACKSQPPGVSLKGATGDETTRELDYKSFYDVKSNELRITSIISYANSYRTRPGTPAGTDGGTLAAYKLLNWLKGGEAAKLFGSTPVADTNDNAAYDFPANAGGTKIGAMYKWVGRVKNVPLAWEGKPAGAPAAVDIKLRVVLGSAIVPNDGGMALAGPKNACATEQATGMFGSANFLMPADFCDELAHGLVEDDVVSYNGHIWVSEGEAPTVSGQPAEVNGTTLKLVQRMQDLRAAGAKRAKQSVVYINACNSERIEKKLMEGLIDASTPVEQYPMLLSHKSKNESNFGYFAEHDTILMIDLLGGRPLVNLMLDLTTTLRPATFDSADGAPLGHETPDEARRKLGEYLESDLSKDPASVVVVAYIIEDERRAAQSATAL